MNLLGDLNTNLFQNGKCILNGKGSIASQGSVHTMINRYKAILSNSLFKTINIMSYTCNMQHLHFYWP